MRPLFSILMTSYNREQYIEEAVSSVLSQTMGSLELVIVDDASTDGSVKWCKLIGDPRVKLVVHGSNKGCGKAHRSAISIATGKLIGIVDADDVIVTDALETILQEYQNPDIGVVYSQYELCDSKLNRLKHGRSAKIPADKTWLDIHHLNSGAVGHLRTFRRSVYDKTEGFWTRRSCVDKDLMFKLEEITKLKFIDTVLYKQRLHNTNISKLQAHEQAKNGRLAVQQARMRRGMPQPRPMIRPKRTRPRPVRKPQPVYKPRPQPPVPSEPEPVIVPKPVTTEPRKYIRVPTRQISK